MRITSMSRAVAVPLSLMCMEFVPKFKNRAVYCHFPSYYGPPHEVVRWKATKKWASKVISNVKFTTCKPHLFNIPLVFICFGMSQPVYR